jgi:hypothetical protein
MCDKNSPRSERHRSNIKEPAPYTQKQENQQKQEKQEKQKKDAKKKRERDGRPKKKKPRRCSPSAWTGSVGLIGASFLGPRSSSFGEHKIIIKITT